ncbi:Uncharacterised protein [Mycoplasmopsis maculosa]|uniref:Uncharacterized protein n=1 Tax=Mycoplasmopsis maculosa TaxID=114885 RepID=A0A449B5B5_9BACT|nr:hypothetical protein [Mycoplasmopsis maculosa]VEU75766.1 Uncharacterised protein [Mycoplasmopsis maculosa]
MKKDKLIPLILTTTALSTPLISLDKSEFENYGNSNIEHILTIVDIQKLWKELFADNFQLNFYKQNYYGHSSYKLVNTKKYVSNLNLNSDWFSQNGEINIENINNYKNLSFNDLYSKLKKELNKFIVAEQDIFNVSNVYRPLKNWLSFQNIPVLKNKVKSKFISFKLNYRFENNFNWKFDDDFYYTNNNYTVSFDSQDDYGTYTGTLQEYDDFAGESTTSGEHSDEDKESKSGTITIDNDKFWPAIEYLPISDFNVISDGDYYVLETKEDKETYLSKKFNKLSNLGFYSKIKPFLSQYNNKLLVSSKNPIILTINENIPTFSTTISYIDEEDVKEYIFEKFLETKGLVKENNSYSYNVEFNDYAEYISNIGKNYKKMNLFNNLKELFKTENIQLVFEKNKSYALVRINEYNPNKPIKVLLKPKSQNSNANTFWWERFNITVPKILNNDGNQTQKIFSLSENVSVPQPDSQNISNQYSIQSLEKPNKTFFSQALISLILSPKRNEELIINDKVVPVSLTGFNYEIQPNDKSLKIQVKVYETDDLNNINKSSFNVFTITNNLFEEIEINTVFDEIEFKLHSWDPKSNFNQAQKINPYIINKEFKEITDKDGNLIPNPDYDFKINPNTGTYEQIWTLNKNFLRIPNLDLWPTISKLQNEFKLIEYFSEESESIIVKTIFADNGLILDFNSGFSQIDGYYLGNNIDELGENIDNTNHFTLPVDKEKILYFTTPKGEGWYLLKAIQKTGLTKFYLIYQTNEKFKQEEQKNILDKAFEKLKNNKKINDIKNSKYFTSFREYIKNQSLDIENLTYSNLVIQYENFLLYNNISFDIHFGDLIDKGNPLINDFEKYLIDNNLLIYNADSNTYTKKPIITVYKVLLTNFLKAKMNNNEFEANIYSYIDSNPIKELQPELFTYLNNDNEKELTLWQPDLSLNIFDFKFKYDLDHSSTIINFIKDKETLSLDLTQWLSLKGYKVNWPVKINLNKDKIIEKLANRTLSDWKNNQDYLKEFIKTQILSFEINNQSVLVNDNNIMLNGKEISISKILENINNMNFVFSENGLFIAIKGIFEIDEERFIINDSSLELDIEWAKYSNPFEYLSINNISYDNYDKERLTEELSRNNFINDFIMNTEIDGESYDFKFNYLKDFKVKNLLSDLDTLTSEEYTKYLKDDELASKTKNITKNIVLMVEDEDFVLNKTISEMIEKNLITSNSHYLKLPKNEIRSNLWKVFKTTFDDIERKYIIMKDIIKYWLDKTNKDILISNHKKTFYEDDLANLLSQMKEFKIVLNNDNDDEYWTNVNNFFESKKEQLKLIKANPNAYRFTKLAITNFEKWINLSDKLKNNHRKDIFYNLWKFIDKELELINFNKEEKINLFSHFYTKNNITNVINGIYDKLKTIKEPYSEEKTDELVKNIFNEKELSNSFWLLKTNIVFISPFSSIKGEYGLKTSIFSNINPNELNDDSYKDKNDNSDSNSDSDNSGGTNSNSPDSNKQRLDLSNYSFNDINFYIEDGYISNIKENIISEIIKNILSVFERDDEFNVKVINNLSLPLLDDAFFEEIFKKDNLTVINGKNFYKNIKEIKFNSISDSEILTGENKFNINFYISESFDPKKEQKEAKKTKIIWVSSTIVAVLLASGIVTTVLVLNKKQRKVKVI